MTALTVESGWEAGTTVDAEAAASRYEAMHERLRLMADTLAQTFCPYQWLWYLRRLPDLLFTGQLASTAPYDRSLVEALSGFSRAPSEAGPLHFPVDPDHLRPVLRLVALALCIADVHVGLRRAGKGFSFSFDPAVGPFPTPAPDAGLSEAVNIYDQRSEAGSGGVLG